MFEKQIIFKDVFYCIFFGLENRMKHIFGVHICFYNLRSGGASFSDLDKLSFEMRIHSLALKYTHRHTREHASKALGSEGTADIVVPWSVFTKEPGDLSETTLLTLYAECQFHD